MRRIVPIRDIQYAMRARGREYKHADSGARARSGGAHRAAERAANAHACGHKHEREHEHGHGHVHASAHVHAHAHMT